MRVLTVVVGIPVLLGCSSGLEEIPLTVDGEARSYQVHVPEGLGAGAPVVLVFHGGGGRSDHKGRKVARLTGFTEVADDFVVVYPNAVDGSWNDERGSSDRDDVAYVDAVLDDVLAATGGDPQRVYAAGISNGGFFTQRLACERSERFAAFASVIATFPVELACTPSRAVPILLVGGTDDPVVPWDGGEIRGHRGFVTAMDDAVGGWVARSGCEEAPIVRDWPDVVADGTTIHESRWCSDVRLLEVRGGGHTWPGGPQYAPRFLIGRVSEELDATAEILAWFGVGPPAR